MEFLIRFPVFAIWRSKGAPLALGINEKPNEFYLPYFSDAEQAGAFVAGRKLQAAELYELDKAAFIRLLRFVDSENCHWAAMNPSGLPPHQFDSCRLPT